MTAQDAADPDRPNAFRDSYLIVFHITKDVNIGHLVRTANGFGCTVVVIGRKNWSRLGAVGRTRRTTPWEHHLTFTDAVASLRKRGCRIIGIEIDPDATSVWQADLSGPVAFVAGNEGEGLTESQRKHCDQLVYVPQYGTAVSLNVNVATSIVLHHHSHQNGMAECEIEGTKFLKARSPNIEIRNKSQ